MSQAEQICRQEVERDPHNPLAHLLLGAVLFNVGRLTEAEVHLRRAARVNPTFFQPQMMLAQCLERLGQAEKAASGLRKAIDACHVSSAELSRIVPNLLVQRCTGAAVKCAKVAAAREPGLLRSQAQLARSLIEAGSSTEAAYALENPVLPNLVEAEKVDGEAIAILGSAYQSIGHNEDARECYRKAMALPSGHAFAFYSYTHSGRIGESDRGLLESREAMLNGQNLPGGDLAYLHFGLGKAWEDLGDYELAMRHFDAGNDIERRNLPGIGSFNGPQLRGMVEGIIATFTKEFIAQNRNEESESERPVFVIGMIRSGTTLAEQILSSHPRIGGAGELPFWGFNALDIFDVVKGELHRDRLQAAAKSFDRILASAGPGKDRVVDKAPGNYTTAGLIHLAMPHARIFHMRRSPIDTCLSVYTTHNRAAGEFGFQRSNIVFAYREYQRLVAHWRSVLPPNRFKEIDYETLVTDPEPTVRTMLDFVDVEWNDACLKHQSNPHAVSTPSSWQVRQPFYRTSIERWRRFEPWLGEFRELVDSVPRTGAYIT